MATHSSVLAWRIPGTGEPGGLPSMAEATQQQQQGGKIPHALQAKKTKTENRKNVVTNSIKTLKMAHISKKNLQTENPACATDYEYVDSNY